MEKKKPRKVMLGDLEAGRGTSSDRKKFAKEFQRIQENAKPLTDALELLNKLRNSTLAEVQKYLDRNPPNAQVLAALVGIAVMSAKREQARENQEKGKAKMREARLYVLDQWERHKEDYKGKSDFARVIVPLVKKLFGVSVAHKTITDRWLK
jgi:hypothetical protein